MKFLHTSDLHIGKTVHEFSMIAEQRHVLGQIVDIAEKESVDVVVIAGDIYDRSIPSTEAVNLLDSFLTQLTGKGIKVLMISGNHDSPERVGFADKILEKQGLYIGGSVEEKLREVTFEDSYGKVTFVLLPFTKPAVVGAGNSQETVQLLLERNGYGDGWKNSKEKDEDDSHRYILITHFFVTGSGGEQPELSDSETTLNVGGLEQVGEKYFEGFDYVALGHIHKPQKIGNGQCYYAGSPLKYSFSECNQIKGVNLVTMEENLEVKMIPLVPMHEMRKIKGKLNELIRPEVVREADSEDYIQAILTDEEELIDPIGTLRTVYPNVMQIQLEKNEQRGDCIYETKIDVRGKSTLELFREFYEQVKGEPMDERREQIVRESIKLAGKGEYSCDQSI